MNKLLFQAKQFLLVDNDPHLFQQMEYALSRYGAILTFISSGQQALAECKQRQPDVVVLNAHLPDQDGWQVCAQLRALTAAPIVMLVQANNPMDWVCSLESNADEVVARPAPPRKLLARLNSLLCRQEMGKSLVQEAQFDDGYLQVDLARRSVLANGQEIHLTRTEFDIFSLLLRRPGRVYTYRQILQSVWGAAYLDSINYVHVYVAYLRRKIEPDPRRPRYLHKEHGHGYYFSEQAV